jgi:type IV secretory pathway VirD2 relaxase
MGRGRRAPSRDGSGSFRSALLARLGRGRVAWGHAAGPRRRAYSKAHRPDARRVVVKAHVVRLTARGARAAALHLRYIERDGVEKDGSKGVLYDADGAVRREIFEEPRLGERHQFRFIVSPEDAAQLDLTGYVRRLMAQVERDLGRRIEWAAVNHYNTEHPHAHLVIRGVDREGRELRFDRNYIANGLRWRAQEIATQELGPRHEHEIRRARAREVTQERFTSLDRELERCAKDHRVELGSLHRAAADHRSSLVGRLEQLERFGMAERVSSGAWELVEGWQAQLRDLGSRGDILKQIHTAIRGDPSRYRIVRAGDALPANGVDTPLVLWGRVASKGLSDELKGDFYAVLETPTGAAYHVPLDRRSAEELRTGDLVSFTTRPEPAVRPIDRHIAAVARAHGGVYAFDAAATADGESPWARRRLRELERLGLATAESPGQWRVGPDLLGALEERHRQTPVRHESLVRREPLSLCEQVRHPGPVWLDQLEVPSLAPHGFGAEVRQAIEERRAVLHDLGIAPGDPDRVAPRRELQRRAVGEEVAARSGQTFLAQAPSTFRGRLRPWQEHDAYAVVSDGARFVLVPASPDLRVHVGKTVVVSRDAKGHVLVRSPDRDRGL